MGNFEELVQKWPTKKKDIYIENKDQNKFYENKNINQEKLIKEQSISLSLESKKKILFQMENCICKIFLKKDEIGIGFLCKFPFNNNDLPVLITNNHIMNNLENNKYIKLNFNNEVKEIKIDNSRKIYTLIFGIFMHPKC